MIPMQTNWRDVKEFKIAMQGMAADPQIQAECEAIGRDTLPGLSLMARSITNRTAVRTSTS